MKLFPVGLFDRLANQITLLDSLPAPIVKSIGSFLVMLKILPDDAQNALAALFAPRNRDASMAFLKMISKWIQSAKNASNGKVEKGELDEILAMGERTIHKPDNNLNLKKKRELPPLLL
jgi:hypothetical protein